MHQRFLADEIAALGVELCTCPVCHTAYWMTPTDFTAHVDGHARMDLVPVSPEALAAVQPFIARFLTKGTC